MEAERIKKKLNGAILKGKKVKVDEARPKKRKHTDVKDENSQPEENIEPLSQEKKKRKKAENVVPGHELSSGKKVKRGWTEPKSEQLKKKKDKTKSSSKPQASSKYTENEELLFKTKIPKNKTARKERESKKETKARGPTVVHEFEKTTSMPSFLRDETSGGKSALKYEDGKGWLDSEGNLVETEGKRASKRRKAARDGIEHEILQLQSAKPETATRLVETTLEVDENSSSATDTEEEKARSTSQARTKSAEDEDEDEDDDGTSSSGDSDSSEGSEASSTSNFSDTRVEGRQSTSTTPPKAAVHPLEALFKKPMRPASSQTAANSQDIAKPSLEVQTSFSFFSSRDDNDDLPPMPMTPFSSQDLRTRETRSAAPTPDTAHPSRMSSIFNGDDSEEELSEMGDDDAKDEPITKKPRQQPGSQQLQIPQTDFEKQFWEKRGENNRAWKARRRAVLKEKRQRENRARRPKNW